MHVIRTIFLILGLLFFISLQALAGPAKFAYQGQIVKDNGQALEANSVQFKIEILSPSPSLCVLYEESHTINMTASNGIFNLTVGEGVRPGTGTYQDLSTLAEALDNSIGLVTPTDCVSGPTYTAANSDGRKLRLTFNDGSGPVTLTQDHNIVSVPYAANATSVDGLTSSDLLQINTGVGFNLDQTNLDFVFNDANWTELQALLDGTSTSFGVAAAPTSDVDNNNQKIITLDDPTADGDATNKGYVDGNIGGQAVNTGDLDALGPGNSDEVLAWDGSQWESRALDDTTKLPLAGGTMTGNLNMGSQDITNANDIAAGNNVSVGNNLTVSGGIGVTNGMNSGAAINLNNESELRFSENTGNGTDYVALKAPAALAGNVVWTLPGTDGLSGQMLQTNGSGTLSWSDPSSLGYIQDGGNATGSTIVVGTNDAQSLQFETNNTTAMTIDSSGNVGIGTTAPVFDLVIGDGSGSRVINMDGAAGAVKDFNFSSNGLARWTIRSTGTAESGLNAGSDFLVRSRTDAGTTLRNDFFIERSSGNIGVGTVSPNERLSVVGNISVAETESGLVFETVAQTSAVKTDGKMGYIYVSDDDGGTFPFDTVGNMVFQSREAGARGFAWVNGVTPTVKMVLDGSGQMGIGTTAPSEKLDVVGTVKATAFEGDGSLLTGVVATNSSAGESTGNFIINTDSDGSTGDGGVLFQTNGGTVASISESGNIGAAAGSAGTVGIGFQSDSDTGIFSPALDTISLSAGGVEGLRVSNTPGGVNYVEIIPGAVGVSPLITADGADVNIDLTLSPKGTGNTIFSSGNVGIGTTNPTFALHARSTSAATTGYFESTNIATVIGFSDTNTTFRPQLGSSGNDLFLQTSGSTRMVVDSAGNVGIGSTTPNVKLDINGSIRSTTGSASSTGKFLLSDSAGVATIQGNPWANGLIFSGASDGESQPDMVLAGGDVGIGTTTPSEKLEVVGTVKATAFEGDGSLLTGVVATNSSSGESTGNYIINTDSDGSTGDGGVLFQSNGGTVASISESGNIGAAAGTAGTVGIGFQNDSDTGIFSPALDTISLSAGGIEGLRVSNTPAGVNYVEITPGATGVSPLIAAEGADVNIDLTLSPKGSGNILLPTGYVGVGTTSPDSILHVEPGPAAANTAGANIKLYAQDSTGPGSSTGGSIYMEVGDGAGGWGPGNMDFNLKSGFFSFSSGSNSTYTPNTEPYNLININNGWGVDGNSSFINYNVVNGNANAQKFYVGAFSTAGAGSYSPSYAWVQQTGAGTFAERMRINSDGNIGIGTTNPTEKLEVVGTVKATAFEGTMTSTSNSSDSNYVINTDADGSTGDGGVLFQNDGATVAEVTENGRMHATTGTNNAPSFAFQGDSNTGMFRPTNGAVGFVADGVEGLRITHTASGVNYVEIKAGATGNGPTIAAAGSDANVDLNLTPKGTGHTFITSGSLGIGTNNPSDLLTVWDSTDLSGSDATEMVPMFSLSRRSASRSLILGRDSQSNENAIIAAHNSHIRLGRYHSADTPRFTEYMRIANGGNIAIGTSGPLSKFHSHGLVSVTDGASASGNGAINLSDNNNGSNSHMSSIFGKNGGLALSGSNSSADAPHLYVSNGGNVGIGTTSAEELLTLKKSSSFAYTPSGASAYPGSATQNTSIMIENTNSLDDTAAFLNLIASPTAGNRQFSYIGAVANSSTAYSPHIVFGHRDGNTSYTETMRIHGNGNVGIGTTNPSSQLEVYEDSSVSRLRISGAGSNYTAAEIVLESRGSADFRGQGVFMLDTLGSQEWFAGTPYSSTDKYIISRSPSATHDPATAQNANAFFAISSAGNVGIGTTNPSDILHIKLPGDDGGVFIGNNSPGDLSLSAGASSILMIGGDNATGEDAGISFRNEQTNVDWGIYNDVSDADKLKFQKESNAPTMVFDGSNVGIGTTAPATALHVVGSIRADGSASNVNLVADTNQGFVIENDNVTGGWARGLVATNSGTRQGGAGFLGSIGTTDSYHVGFGTSWWATDAKLTVLNSGNVGIGYTVPTSKLSVDSSSSGNTAYALRLSNSSDVASTATGLLFSVDASSRTTGNLGKGGLIYSRTNSNGRGKMHFLQNSADNNADATSADAVMTIDNSGNVGIGTTTPSSKFHVDGSGAGGGVCVTSDGTCSAIPSGGQISAETTLNTGADYAEYFEAEEVLVPGDLVGLNIKTGKVRHYKAGDNLIGFVSTNPGVIGNSELANHEHSVLVALTGQVPFDNSQVIIKNGQIYTNDHLPVGYLLANGHAYINLSSADHEQNRQIQKIKKENDRQLATVNKKLENTIKEKDRQIDELKLRLEAIEKLLSK